MLDNWLTLPSEEYCDSVRDGTHDSPKFHESGYPLITSKAIKDGRLLFDNAGLISETDYSDINKRSKVEQWDILFTMIGTLGEVYLETSEDVDYAIKNVGLFKCGEELKAKWLYYWFRSSINKSSILQLRRGASQQYLPLGTLRNLNITYPSDSQIIVKTIDVLSSYDDLIENNRRRIQLLEESARLLYKEWFVHLRFPGHEHVKITDGVPSGWNSVPLEDLCFQVKNTVKPQDVEEGTNYIGLEHIPRRSITLSEWDTADKVTSNKFSYKKGDLIFGKIRPYFHKVGFTLTDGIASSDAIVIRPLKDEFYFYLLALISSDYFVSLASKTVKEGSKMPRADWNFLLKQSFILPSDSLLEVFSDYLDSIVRQLEVLALQNKNLATSRDILLPRLMNGELTV